MGGEGASEVINTRGGVEIGGSSSSSNKSGSYASYIAVLPCPGVGMAVEPRQTNHFQITNKCGG